MKKDLYLKKKNFEINSLKSEIAKLQNDLNETEENINKNRILYQNREIQNYKDIVMLISKDLFLSEILNNIDNLKRKKEEILSIVKNKKIELSKLLGEKKAYEKYKKKKRKEKELKEHEKESQDANEIFIRKFYSNK